MPIQALAALEVARQLRGAVQLGLPERQLGLHAGAAGIALQTRGPLLNRTGLGRQAYGLG
ncbi:hypothetical protein [Pseudomonas sp. 31 E 6]|nr:hypothetical protein [Pseudomonas sp. 31 E 5]CRM73928.1 hypothetical protein [Pseudomonas sp. 31 E 6]